MRSLPGAAKVRNSGIVSWLRMGTPIVGRYVLLGPIGYGGVSVVYEAVDTVTPGRTAIKLLAPAFLDDPYARDKVHHEALITQRLRHPSVPKVYGHGEAVLPDGSRAPYVAMELLSGVLLAGRIAGGPLPWRYAVKVAATIADVLAIAHRRGVVHRDLTPGNIMLTAAGPKIIDFGEATTVEPVSPAARAATPLPARRVTTAGSPADDVYALGVVLYQMLTGRSPYDGRRVRTATAIDMAAARLRRVAPTPVLAVPGLPRQAAEICRACMAKRPQERPGSAAAALALWTLLVPPARVPDFCADEVTRWSPARRRAAAEPSAGEAGRSTPWPTGCATAPRPPARRGRSPVPR